MGVVSCPQGGQLRPEFFLVLGGMRGMKPHARGLPEATACTFVLPLSYHSSCPTITSLAWALIITALPFSACAGPAPEVPGAIPGMEFESKAKKPKRKKAASGAAAGRHGRIFLGIFVWLMFPVGLQVSIGHWQEEGHSAATPGANPFGPAGGAGAGGGAAAAGGAGAAGSSAAWAGRCGHVGMGRACTVCALSSSIRS